MHLGECLRALGYSDRCTNKNSIDDIRATWIGADCPSVEDLRAACAAVWPQVQKEIRRQERAEAIAQLDWLVAQIARRRALGQEAEISTARLRAEMARIDLEYPEA